MLSSFLCSISITDIKQILCAILNRVTNFAAFDSDTSSLVYLNWYAGEITTAVIVTNVPLLWPLISRVLKTGSFQQTTATSDRHTKKSGYALQSMTNGNDYMRSASEERIAELDEVDSNDTKHPDDLVLTMDKGQTTTHVIAGSWDDRRDSKGHAIDYKDSGSLDRDLEQGSKPSHIVKTVDVSQFSRGM